MKLQLFCCLGKFRALSTDARSVTAMQQLMIHPDRNVQPLNAEGKPVSVTHVTAKAKKARKAKVKTQPTLEDLRLMVKARGMKVTTKHTKGELMAMFVSGEYITPAAYARAKAKRDASK